MNPQSTPPLGQHFIVGLKSKSLNKVERNFLIQNDVGGVILFRRNYESPEQIRQLCEDIQSLQKQTLSRSSFFIAIDMEGGRIQQFPPPYTQWPAISYLGQRGSSSLSFDFAMAMGEELLTSGINLNFAPCCDILSNQANEVIGDRAAGDNAEIVTKITSALTRGYLKSGLITCAKHFPGHGHTFADSHDELPIENLTLLQIEERELIPFTKLTRSGIDTIMTGHILFPEIDEEWPATLSSFFLQEICRKKLKFRGLIVADDLDMKALTLNYDKNILPVQALKAGSDILLYCHDLESAQNAFEQVNRAYTDGELNSSFIEKSQKRISELKSKKLIDLKDIPWKKETIGHPDHQNLANEIIKTSLLCSDSTSDHIRQ